MNATGQIMTVLGPIFPGELGITLPHEHILVDFIGAERVNPDRYKVDRVIDLVLPFLEQAKSFGLKTFVECTPSYLAKDPEVLTALSKLSGLHILTNTGYYGARKGLFLPAHGFIENSTELANRWIAEWTEGIGGTGVRPGFIKIGINNDGPLSAIDRKLVQAAAKTHLATGLTIMSHTVDGPVFEVLEELNRQGVDGSAFIWTHAGGDPDPRRHIALAELGGWVEFDWVKEPIDEHVALLKTMKENSKLDHVLLSHDAGWFDPGKVDGGSKDFKPYTVLFEKLLPALAQNGFTDSEIELLVVTNPARAFTIGVKVYR